tara:strand:+ start:197 stop:472 length:276 start_codon:yes stop_codon:yes gene_type:complete
LNTTREQVGAWQNRFIQALGVIKVSIETLTSANFAIRDGEIPKEKIHIDPKPEYCQGFNKHSGANQFSRSGFIANSTITSRARTRDHARIS